MTDFALFMKLTWIDAQSKPIHPCPLAWANHGFQYLNIKNNHLENICRIEGVIVTDEENRSLSISFHLMVPNIVY